MTVPAVADPSPEVLGSRYVRKAGGDSFAHLLTRTWTAGRGNTRPAVCGARAQKWRSVEAFDDPDRYQPCPDCTTGAGLDQPSPTPVRIGGRAGPTRGRRIDAHALTPVAPDTHALAARMSRRAGFLADVAPLSEDATAYRPRLASDDFRPSWLYPPR